MNRHLRRRNYRDTVKTAGATLPAGQVYQGLCILGERRSAYRRRDPDTGVRSELREVPIRCKERIPRVSTQGQSIDANGLGGPFHSSVEAFVIEVERRERANLCHLGQQPLGGRWP